MSRTILRARLPSPSTPSYVVTRQTAFAEYTARDGARLEYFLGKYWLLGGWQPVPNGWSATNAVTNEVWSSPDLITWTKELDHDDAPPTSGAGARWYPRHTHMSCVFDGKLWIFGSDQYDPGGAAPNTSQDPIDSSVWSSVDGVTWVQVAPSSQDAGWWGHGRGVWDAIPAVFGGYMHIIGGYRTAAGSETNVRIAWPSCSEHWRSADGVTWEQMPDLPFSRARTLNAVEVNGKLVIAGGISSPPPYAENPATPMNDVWTWDGTTWTQTSDGSSAAWEGRSWLDVASYDGKLWVLSGWDDDAFLNRGGARWTSDYGVTWNELPTGTVGIPPSHADGVLGRPDGIAVAGGFSQKTNTWFLTAGDPGTVDYPGTLELSAWWYGFTGGTYWLGRFSGGLSAVEHLIEATHPPTAGAALNGHVTASFNGTDQKFVGPTGLLATSFSIWWVFKASAAVPDYGAATPWAAPGIDDTSGAGLAIGFNESGVRAGYHDGTDWDSVVQAASVGAWHRARIRSDGTKIELSVDGNAWTSVARDPINSITQPLRVGTCFDGSFFSGLTAAVGVIKRALTDEEFDALDAHLVSKYDL